MSAGNTKSHSAALVTVLNDNAFRMGVKSAAAGEPLRDDIGSFNYELGRQMFFELKGAGQLDILAEDNYPAEKISRKAAHAAGSHFPGLWAMWRQMTESRKAANVARLRRQALAQSIAAKQQKKSKALEARLALLLHR